MQQAALDRGMPGVCMDAQVRACTPPWTHSCGFPTHMHTAPGSHTAIATHQSPHTLSAHAVPGGCGPGQGACASGCAAMRTCASTSMPSTRTGPSCQVPAPAWSPGRLRTCAVCGPSVRSVHMSTLAVPLAVFKGAALHSRSRAVAGWHVGTGR